MKDNNVHKNDLLKYLSLSIFLVLLSCSNNSENSDIRAAKEGIAAPVAKNQSEVAEVQRKLIKEGYVTFETDNLISTRETIIKTAEKYNGYVSSDREFESPGRFSNTIVIRVPANHFDNLLEEATKGIEKFDSKEITVKDVTEEFLDIEARLKTKKELEKRYLDLLKKANKVNEILQIEKQIGQLRSEIESVEGRLEYLQNQVSYSTLTITCYEQIPNQTKFGEKFKNGFKNGWNNLIWFFVMLVNVWPFILIGVLIAIGFRIYRKNK